MTAAPRRLRGDDGFTLAELVISTMIMGIVLTAVTSAVIVGLRNGSRSVDTLGPSTGAALLSHHFTADVQSASVSDISPGGLSGCDHAPPAGSRNVLALAWLDNAGELPVRHAVAYQLDPATAQLSRVSCDSDHGVQVAVLARQVLSADARVDTASGGISLDVTAGEEIVVSDEAAGAGGRYRFQLRAYGRLAGSDAGGLGSGVARLPRGEVAGTVTKYDDVNGTTNPEPVQGVTLSLTNAETDVVTTTGINGRFYFGTLDDGRYNLTLETSAFLPTAGQSTIASEPNRITVPVTVDAAEQDVGAESGAASGPSGELAQALSVVQVGSVAGTARTDRYVMLGGLKVELSGAVQLETDTDAAGGYTFTDVPAGGYTVEVEPPEGYVAVSGAECVVTVVGGERSTCPEAVFKARLSAISGTVRTDADIALGGVNVVLSGATTRTVATDSDGRYRFGELLDGSYTVTVQAPAGYGLISGGTCAVILTGQDAVCGDAVLQRASTSVTGIVLRDVDLDGIGDVPSVGAYVKIYANNRVVRYLYTGADGLFRFDDVPPGNYIVWHHAWSNGMTAYNPANGQVPITVSPGQPIAPVTFVDRKPCTVLSMNQSSIRLDERGLPMPEQVLTVATDARCSDQVSFTFDAVTGTQAGPLAKVTMPASETTSGGTTVTTIGANGAPVFFYRALLPSGGPTWNTGGAVMRVTEGSREPGKTTVQVFR